MAVGTITTRANSSKRMTGIQHIRQRSNYNTKRARFCDQYTTQQQISQAGTALFIAPELNKNLL
jgi:hypothetical protein